MKKRMLPILAAMLCLLLLGCGKNKKPAETTGKPMPTLATGNSSDDTSHGQNLGLQKAQKIALEDAGFTYDQVIYLRTSMEKEDGVTVYEVKFTQGGYDYEYTIHSKTGEILDVDKESADRD